MNRQLARIAKEVGINLNDVDPKKLQAFSDKLLADYLTIVGTRCNTNLAADYFKETPDPRVDYSDLDKLWQKH